MASPKVQRKPRAPRAGAATSRAELARGAALHYLGTALLASVCAILGGIGLHAIWLTLVAEGAIVVLAFRAYHARKAELERHHAREAQLSVYRVAETMARAEREEDLVRHALDTIAESVGTTTWALYLHRNGQGAFSLAATRGLSAEADLELTPDPPGPEAISPASRAAWLGETVTGPGLSSWAFPARGTLGSDPVVISMPFADHDDLPAVLQCFLPRGGELGAEQHALLRWMATQLSSGLKRLRLEHKDQLLASYMMSTGEILFGLDLSGVVTHANAAAERALGAPPGALVGSPLDRLATPEREAAGASLIAKVKSSGDWAGSVRFMRGDGSRFPADVRLSRAFDRRGTLTAIVLVGRDVTERREQEAEQRKSAEALEVLNAKLQRANAGLEEAQRHQNDFLANTSHELRTPLNGVIGFAMLLEQGAAESDEERADFARSIREAAEHLLGVINDLLDLAKVAAGRFQLALVPGDLRSVIEQAVEAVGPVAERKGLDLHVDLPETALVAAIDPARLRQVMLNLLGNAVKFTDKGGVRVRAWRDPDTEEARVSVEDTGVGIARDLKARLFTKFTQADSSYHRRHQGTGLGLSISKALVENMGGTIVVESEGLNRGTKVTLALPAPIGSLTTAT